MLEEMLLERIKIYRKRARLSQSDMATYLGYKGKSGYSNLENGKVKMTVEQLEQLITILSIPQEDLVRIINRCYQPRV